LNRKASSDFRTVAVVAVRRLVIQRSAMEGLPFGRGPIVAFEIAQHEARGVPDLVGEVAIALDTLLADADVPAEPARAARVNRKASVPNFSMTTTGSATLP